MENLRCPVLEDLEDTITCQVCFQKMEKPKSLQCLHSFCLKCLAEMKPAKMLVLSCPVCRMDTKVPNGDPQLLPTAFLINRIADLIVKHDEAVKGSHGCSNGVSRSIGEMQSYCTAEHLKVVNVNKAIGTTMRNDEFCQTGGFHAFEAKEKTISTGKKESKESPPENNETRSRRNDWNGYKVSLEKAPMCNEAKHVFKIEKVNQDYHVGDAITLSMLKYCKNEHIPCCAWTDDVNGNLVDDKGRAVVFKNLRALNGGWQLSCNANYSGMYTAIIKVNKKPIAAVPINIQ